MREQINGLDLRSNKTEWQRVIREYRGSQFVEPHKPSISRGRVKNRSSNAKYRKELKQYDFFEGPMTVRRKGKYYAMDNELYQFCVRSRRGVKLFNQNLHSVVFF